MGHHSTSHRTRRPLAAAAIGALAGFGASHADASLIIDVRAISATHGVFEDGKFAPVFNPGDTVTVAVFARVSGTNGINDEMMQSAGGSLASNGSLKGNISGGVVAPFNAPSFTNGSVQDFDSDGDLDLGSLGSTSTGKLFARSNAMQPINATADPNTGEIQIAQATFTYTGGGGGAGDISYIVRTNATGGPLTAAALWVEDGSTANSNPSGSIFAAGAPVSFGAPEPAGVGLLALSSIGLLARRRR